MDYQNDDTRNARARAIELAKCGNFHHIYSSLKEEHLLESNVLRTKEKYQEFFETEHFVPEEKIWEILTVLELYDTETFEHSLRTFRNAKNISTKILIDPKGEQLIFRDLAIVAGVPHRDLLLSALCHDIGKIILPVEILHNSLTDEEMYAILIRMIRHGKNLESICEKIGLTTDELVAKKDAQIISYLEEKRIRPVNLVPLDEAFPEAEYPGMLNMLKNHGFLENQTIKSVARIHEDEGLRIFESLDEPIIADLVGHHHNYHRHTEAELRFVMNIPSLKNLNYDTLYGVYHIIKIADTMDALMSKRPYKKSMSELAAMAELTRQAESNRTEKNICYLWLSNEYPNIISQNPEDKPAIRTIESFLENTREDFI